MKNFIASLFLIGPFLTAYNACAEDIVLSSAQNLVFKTENGKEVVYDKKGDLYNGAVALTDSENRRVIYIYSNGKKHGDAFSKFSSDKVELKVSYINGMKNGDEVSFYLNGNPRYKRTYKDDVLEGQEVLYYQNGKPQKVSHYVNGKLDGTIDYFDENGNRTRIETYKNGIKEGPERIIANNILREEIQFVDGKREGIYKTYSSEGSWREIPFKNDKKEGEGRIYSPNGMILESVVYADNKRNGMYKKYSPKSGQLLLAENYKDDQKDGVTRSYDDKGKLLSVSYFMDGIELANVHISQRSELQNIQDAFFDGQLNKYSNKKTLWYKILWLGLNLDKPEILEALEKEMKMYAVDINEMPIYRRWSGSLFENENKQLFFGLTPLDYAVNIEAPTEVLQKFVNQIEDRNSRGNTALRDAVRLNKADMVKFLLLNNADLNETDDEGNDILLYSVITSSPHEITESIIQAGGNVNTKNKVNQTPLSVALAQKDTNLVKMLIQNGANTDNMPDGQNLIHYAYDKKVPLEIMNELINTGININSTDDLGNGLLLRALMNNDDDTVLFALEHNADVNQKNDEGETAVGYVLFNKVSPEVSKKIFEREYDVVNKLEKHNKMVWKVLMEQNKLDLLKKTWDRMPDITRTADANGEIPMKVALNVPANPKLHELALSYVETADNQMVWDALKNKDLSLFINLMHKNADINSKNENGETLLIYMLKNGYDNDYTALVLKDGLILGETDNEMQTALDIALDKGNLEVADYLLKAEDDQNRNEIVKRLLAKANPHQNKQVELLLEYFKDIDTSLPDGDNLSLRAVKNLNFPLFKYLLDNKKVDFGITDENGNGLLLSLADYFEHDDDNEKMADLVNNFMGISDLLIINGADVNARNSNGETLLIRLAKSCGPEYKDLSELLFQNNADTTMKDQYNKTAEDYRQNDEKTEGEPEEDKAE